MIWRLYNLFNNFSQAVYISLKKFIVNLHTIKKSLFSSSLPILYIISPNTLGPSYPIAP